MTAEEVSKNTKERIIDAACELFARSGFSGTSVRDISKLADVNLSAINYHFKNKQSLYLEVFNYNSTWIENQINMLGKDDSLNTKELTLQTYDIFTKNSHPLANTFKIFLSDEVIMDAQQATDLCQNRVGPPGHDIFYKKISRDVGEDVSSEQIDWAVEIIFSLTVHWALIMGTNIMKEKAKFDPSVNPENSKKSISQLVDSTLLYLKTKKD